MRDEEGPTAGGSTVVGSTVGGNFVVVSWRNEESPTVGGSTVFALLLVATVWWCVRDLSKV